VSREPELGEEELGEAVDRAAEVLRILRDLDALEPTTDLADRYLAALEAKARTELEP
jgi:hypothetical protein